MWYDSSWACKVKRNLADNEKTAEDLDAEMAVRRASHCWTLANNPFRTTRRTPPPPPLLRWDDVNLASIAEGPNGYLAWLFAFSLPLFDVVSMISVFDSMVNFALPILFASPAYACHRMVTVFNTYTFCAESRFYSFDPSFWESPSLVIELWLCGRRWGKWFDSIIPISVAILALEGQSDW